jgi:hypothetical protein
MKQITTSFFPKNYWRHLLLMVIVFGTLVLTFSLPPFAQNVNYHDFADKRVLFGIPNFFDVASNLAFLFVGVAGLRICFKEYLGNMHNAWIVMFTGITLISAGSAYYHLNPGNQTLVWARLPMTVGFIGLLIAELGENVHKNFGWFILPALLTGFFSVIYWHWFDDLRFYIWVQLISLLIIPIVMILYQGRYSHQWMLIFALGLYALAKILEMEDEKVFAISRGLVSGHTVKHLLSALGCFTIVLMLQRRKLLQ